MAHEATTTLRSTNQANFLANVALICEISTNSFGGLLTSNTPNGSPVVVDVPEPSDILGIILCAIHGEPATLAQPSLPTIRRALLSFGKYGINARTLIRPGTPLFDRIASFIPADTLEVYVLASELNIETLAIHASSHLLGLSLQVITDDQATRMGTEYLMRLFNLHSKRLDGLKRLLFAALRLHRPNTECGVDEQRITTGRWFQALGSLVWVFKPDLSGTFLELKFEPVIADIPCSACQEELTHQLRDIITQWAAIKGTI